MDGRRETTEGKHSDHGPQEPATYPPPPPPQRFDLKHRFLVPGVAAAALAVFLTVPAAPSAAADCDPASIARGTYDRERDVFTPGTTNRHIDYRFDCVEDPTDSDTTVSLAIDPFPSDHPRRPESLFVMRLTSDDPARVNEENAGGVRYVVVSSASSAAIETDGAYEHGLRFRDTDPDDGGKSIWAESRATVKVEGNAADGVSVLVEGSGTATVINRGTITTYGGADTTGTYDLTSQGIWARSDEGNARALNHGRIETQGVASQGVYAESYGSGTVTATATNYGTIVNGGGIHESTNTRVPWRSHGVFAYVPSGQGAARAENRAGATIRATGVGGIGVTAETGGTGAAVAENWGAITVTGDAYEVTDSGNPQYLGQLRGAAGVVAFSVGTGRASAVNQAGGTVGTTSDGSPGVWAWSGGDGGDASVENRGTVVTRGNRVTSATNNQAWSRGLDAWSSNGAANAVNDVGGIVETHGLNAHAVFAGSNTRTAQAVNKGNVRTHATSAAQGEFPGDRGAFGVFAWSRDANALAENDATGQIATKGPWAFGLIAETRNDGARTSAQARAVNRGRVTTGGRQAEGVLAIASRGGSEANPNIASALNAAGARIETTGDETGGLVAAITVGEGGTSFGTARAENAGTIVSSGRAGVWDDNEPENKDSGVLSVFFNFTDEEITDTGDATVINSGDVTVTGAGMTGLRALAYGRGTATVEMTGGTVTASAVDDPATAGVDEGGIGIWAGTGDDGMASVTVGGNAVVRAPVAARLVGGTTRLTLNNGFLDGDVEFGDGADTLEASGFGYIGGDVSFGGGQDTLVLNVGTEIGVSSIAGSVTGLEEMFKRGPGIARVHDVTFTGSSLVVEEGRLNVRGHLDLGADGTATIKDSGRLTMEIGDVGANPEDHGRMTAGGGVTLEGGQPAVFAAYDPGLTDEQKGAAGQHLQEEGVAVLGAGTNLMTPDSETGATLKTELGTGEVETVGTIEKTDGAGTVAKLNEGAELGTAPPSVTQPPSPTKPAPEKPVVSGGGGSNEKSLAIGGGAILAFALFDLFDLFDTLSGDKKPNAGDFSPVSSLIERSDGSETGTEYWAHALTGDTPVLAGAAGSLRGLRMGVTTRLGDGFHLGLSGMPQLGAGAGDHAFDGHRYALRGGWESDLLFANVGLSRGDYQARTAFANLDGLGKLSGAFGMRHERASADVGARLGLGGLRVDPSLSLFAGSLDQAAYTAESAALRSEIPALSQRYDGWKARVALAPEDWLGTGSVRWRPALSLATARSSTDGPDGLQVRQADKAGVLSFATSARAQDLPQTTHAIGASLSVAQAGNWKLRGGYVAMTADGEPVHAAVARFRLHF